jgi:serine kinase of HPr protein (carbohydrate metabolism regulator)
VGIEKEKPAAPKFVVQHGSAVLLKSLDFQPSVVFLRGLSGSGKSDLALRLIEGGGQLICDDQVHLERRQDNIFAGPVEAIRGLLEVRGVGLLHMAVADPARLRLVIDLVPQADVPRLPELEKVDILGVQVPRFRLHAFEVSAALKVHKALEVVHRPGMVVK